MRIGILWFDQGSYFDSRHLMVDHDDMPPSWSEWAELAQKQIDAEEAQGNDVVKVAFDAGEFLVFCIRNGLTTNEAGRQKYVALKLDDPAGIPVR